MVKVRLKRVGSKKSPYYHIVATDSRNPRDGRFIEQLGTYDPAKPEAEATVVRERLDYWLSVGAKMTTRVRHITNRQRRAIKEALAGSSATPAA